MIIQIKINTEKNASYYGVAVGTVIEEDFERYISAVVASEIGNAPLEACKAQAVASRTFAYRYICKKNPISDKSSVAQAFRAERYSTKYQRCIDAARATEGQILVLNEIPIDAYFSSSNGGMTTSSEERWGGVRTYLVSRPDPWDAATHANKLGHGVGMSQNGAKYAAEHGVSYKDILAFYYPGTTFSTAKEGRNGMIPLSEFLEGCKKNAARIKGYKLGCNGSSGLSDCVGYIIGSLELEGQKWGGIHGSNYAERFRTKNAHVVTDAAQLRLGELVYKKRAPGTNGYDLPARYKTGGNMYNGDLNDYYHIGVVTSVNPLTISHCSGGGMHYDKKLGGWCVAGDCSLVDYSSRSNSEDIPVNPAPAESATGKTVVDVPDDTSVNVRKSASTISAVLTKLPEGAEVEVVSTSGTWSKVTYTVKGTGYIMSKYLKKG